MNWPGSADLIDDDAAAFAACVLHHHDRVGAGGNGRAGHDLDGLAAAPTSPAKRFAGANFADDFERAGKIGRPHGEAVADGAGEGGRIAIGGDGFGQHAAHQRRAG